MIYSYKIAASPPLHWEFLQVVKSLTPSSDSNAYQEVIETFGTHFTQGVKLGGKAKAVTSIKTCKAALSGLTSTAIKDCLDAEVSATYNGVTGSAGFQHCQELKKKLGKQEGFSSMFSDRESEVIGGSVSNEDIFSAQPAVHKAWLESLKKVPDVVTYELRALHLLLNSSHPARSGLKRAIETYIKNNALNKVCSESCVIGRQGSARDPCACVCKSYSSMLPNCCPKEKGLATLTVFKMYANGLYGDVWDQTDGVVNVKYDEQHQCTREITNNDNPHWHEKFNFGTIKMSVDRKLQFEVYDNDDWKRDLLGSCSFNLKSGSVDDLCTFDHGTFYFSYTVICAPGLQGPMCDEPKVSPMNPKLAEMFQSRNSILVKNMWKLEQAYGNLTNPNAEVYSGKQGWM